MQMTYNIQSASQSNYSGVTSSLLYSPGTSLASTSAQSRYNTRNFVSILTITNISISTGLLVFRVPYTLFVKREDNQFYLEDPFLSLFIYAEEIGDLREELSCEFEFIWEYIVLEDDGNLTGDALAIKGWFHNYVNFQEVIS